MELVGISMAYTQLISPVVQASAPFSSCRRVSVHAYIYAIRRTSYHCGYCANSSEQLDMEYRQGQDIHHWIIGQCGHECDW